MMDTDQILRMDGLELLDALDDDSVDLKEFLGSEIDDHAIQFAKNNIAAEMAQMKLNLE